MPDNKADWDFGQALIELDFASLDQVREGLAIQDRMREMGIQPKALRDILIEKRYITEKQADVATRKPAKDGLPEIPGYRLEQRIGAGGMGVVFRATQLSISRPVAVKILAPRLAKDPAYVDRFIREARAVAKLSHPNLVSGIDVGEARGLYYFAMEYVEGRTLRKILEERRRLDEPEALKTALQVAKALDHAHRNKIVHGDVKPSNIMIQPDGTAKLCDLGLAREEEKKHEGPALGTKYYMPPEQARGEPLETRADVYALGVTIQEMLTGSPKPGSTVSGAAAGLVARMTDRARDKRPTPGQLVPELEALLKPKATEAARSAPSVRRAYRPSSSSSLVLPVLVILAALGVLGWWFFVRPKGGEATSSGGGSSGDRRETVSEFDQAAETELQQIGLAQDQDPDYERAAEILGRYRDYKAKYKGKAWEGRASKDESAYRKRLEDAARSELEAVREKDAALRGEGRFGDILALYRKYPSKFLKVTESGSTVASEIESLETLIRENHSRDKRAIESMLREGKISEAENKLVFMESYLSEEYKAEFEELREKVRKLKTSTVEAVRQDVLKKYRAIEGPYRAEVRNRDYRGASKHVLTFLDEAWKDVEKPFVFVPGVDYAVLRGLVDGGQCAAIARACECDPESPATVMPGEMALLDLRAAALLEVLLLDAARGLDYAVAAGDKETYTMAGIQGKTGHFRAVNDKVYFYTTDRRYEFAILKNATEADLIRLASRGLDANRAASEEKFGQSASSQVAAAMLYFHADSAFSINALAYFERAQKLGAKGVRIFIASIRAMADQELRKSLGQLWEQALDLYGKKQLSDARDRIQQILQHAEHELVKSWRGKIDEMLAAIDKDLTQAQKLEVELRGKVTFTERGEIRVAYDFEDRRQIEAFVLIDKAGEMALKGNWKLQKGGLDSSGDPAAIRWKPKMAGDLMIEYEMTPVEDVQNVLTELYFNPNERKHYAVTFGFDWIGRGYGDRENVVEDNYGMPRTCILKYPVNVDINEWERQEQWNVWKSRLVGKASAPFRPLRGRPHQIRIERRGKMVRLYADTVLAWEGEDGEYTSGHLLFFADSKVRLDNLVVTYTPAK